MQELEKGMKLALTGPEAERSLARFGEQMAAWGLTPPPTEALIWDFGLGRFADVGLIETWIANEVGPGYCGKYLYVDEGQTCPRHRHRRKHETFFIVKGRVRMDYGGEIREMGEGDVLPVETWAYHTFTGLTPALLLEVSQPCEIEDNFFEDPRIPIGENYEC
ncbi:MAG: cupin domain-containing protein [Planctomycetota bacterium]